MGKRKNGPRNPSRLLGFSEGVAHCIGQNLFQRSDSLARFENAVDSKSAHPLLEGELLPRALGLVVEWAALHRQELLDDWNLAVTVRKGRRTR